MTKLQDLVEDDGNAELLATGFEFSEGPAWNERTQRLHFSDLRGRHPQLGRGAGR